MEEVLSVVDNIFPMEIIIKVNLEDCVKSSSESDLNFTENEGESEEDSSQILKKQKCEICNLIFTRKLKLEEHKKKQHNVKVVKKTNRRPKRRYKCEICQVQLKNLASLNLHSHKQHNLKCEHCEEVFQMKQNLIEHLNEKHSVSIPESYKCNLCKHSFITKDALGQHTDNHHFKCKHCNKEFRTKMLCNQHVSNEHFAESKNLACEICNHKFNTKKKLRRHIRTLHKLKCDHCKLLFQSKKLLAEHKFNIKDGVIFRCTFCLRICDSKAALDTHIQAHHNLKCEHCPKILKSNKILMKHLHAAHSEHTFKCDICPRKFTKQNLLDRHKQLHHTWKCEHCDKVLNSNKSYIQHLALEHEGRHGVIKQRVYICDFCDNQYSRNASLNRHILQKHNLKCDHCDEIFSYRKMLIKHLANAHPLDKLTVIWSSQMFFDELKKCQVCERVFQSCYTLRRHYDLEHPGVEHKTEFVCIECEAVFTERRSFNNHLSTHNVKVNVYEHEGDIYETDIDTLNDEDLFEDNFEQYEEDLSSQDSFEVGLYECLKCTITFENFHELESHSKAHINVVNGFQCAYCDAVISCVYEFEEHGSLHFNSDGEAI